MYLFSFYLRIVSEGPVDEEVLMTPLSTSLSAAPIDPTDAVDFVEQLTKRAALAAINPFWSGSLLTSVCQFDNIVDRFQRRTTLLCGCRASMPSTCSLTPSRIDLLRIYFRKSSYLECQVLADCYRFVLSDT